jgi:hypothetical protein
LTDVTRAPGRPTIYRGIQMRSRLEADFARWLDQRGRRWTYEPQCFAGPHGQYLPDFHVPIMQPSDDPSDDYGDQYLEVKPYELIGDPDAIDAVLRRMEIVLLSAPMAWLELDLWTYGAETLPAKLYRTSDGVWFEYNNDAPDYHSFWPGLGQFEALKDWAAHRLRKAGG